MDVSYTAAVQRSRAFLHTFPRAPDCETQPFRGVKARVSLHFRSSARTSRLGPDNTPPSLPQCPTAPSHHRLPVDTGDWRAEPDCWSGRERELSPDDDSGSPSVAFTTAAMSSSFANQPSCARFRCWKPRRMRTLRTRRKTVRTDTEGVRKTRPLTSFSHAHKAAKKRQLVAAKRRTSQGRRMLLTGANVNSMCPIHAASRSRARTQMHTPERAQVRALTHGQTRKHTLARTRRTRPPPRTHTTRTHK